MRRRVLAAGAFAGLALATAGCSGGGGGPRALPPVAQTARPSASPSPSLSPGVAGDVQAAALHYYDVVNVAINSGDTRELESLSLEGCACRDLVRYIKQTYKRGKPTPAEFVVHSIRVHDIFGQTAATEVAFRVTAYKLLDSSGHVIKDYAEQAGRDDISWVHRDGRWIASNGVILE